jgi:multicomponent Na+:H+ antiporter subunit E
VFHSTSLFVSLCLIWLLLSGLFTPFLLSAGLGSALAVVLFARRMNVVDHEGHPKLPISPTLVRFKPTQKTDVGLVIHAQSITLTPGTIAIEAVPNESFVHGLTRSAAEGVVDSEMDRRATAREGRP